MTLPLSQFPDESPPSRFSPHALIDAGPLPERRPAVPVGRQPVAVAEPEQVRRVSPHVGRVWPCPRPASVRALRLPHVPVLAAVPGRHVPGQADQRAVVELHDVRLVVGRSLGRHGHDGPDPPPRPAVVVRLHGDDRLEGRWRLSGDERVADQQKASIPQLDGPVRTGRDRVHGRLPGMAAVGGPPRPRPMAQALALGFGPDLVAVGRPRPELLGGAAAGLPVHVEGFPGRVGEPAQHERARPRGDDPGVAVV